MDDIYKKIGDHKPNMKFEVLIVFHDMIADMPSNKTIYQR